MSSGVRSGTAVLILVSTKLKSDAEEQTESSTLGKLTFSQTLRGKYGLPESTTALVTVVDRSAYTLW
jgi:hypothetical protein